jgi:hypothetical protein
LLGGEGLFLSKIDASVNSASRFLHGVMAVVRRRLAATPRYGGACSPYKTQVEAAWS